METEDNRPDYIENEKHSCEKNFHQYTLFDITVDPGLKDNDGNELPRPFTKNQMRKWLRKVRWEKNKVLKRVKERARAKERLRCARSANIEQGMTRKALKRKMKQAKIKRNMGIIIDLSFDDLMIEKDMCKMIKQILRCYSLNRRALDPIQFYLTSYGKKSKEIMSRHKGHENWDVEYKEEPYLKLFSKEQLVYLSSESTNVIETFEDNTFYIIGGLVDHNQHKGLCHKIAEEHGIRHARLPLDKYINMKTRKVLTIDHVFEIVLRVSEGLPWQEVLMKVLPVRKGAKICDSGSSSSEDMYDESEIAA